MKTLIYLMALSVVLIAGCAGDLTTVQKGVATTRPASNCKLWLQPAADRHSTAWVKCDDIPAREVEEAHYESGFLAWLKQGRLPSSPENGQDCFPNPAPREYPPAVERCIYE